MKDSPYYTFHLQMHLQSADNSRVFLPEELHQHHYASFDEAFTRLFSLPAINFDIGAVNIEKLGYLLMHAFVTPPFDDQPIAQLVLREEKTDLGHTRPQVIIEQMYPELLSSAGEAFLRKNGVANPGEPRILLAHYDEEWDLHDPYPSKHDPRLTGSTSFQPADFISEIVSVAPPRPGTLFKAGRITRSTTHSNELRECVTQLMQLDLNLFSPDIATLAGRDRIQSATVKRPGDSVALLEVYHVSPRRYTYKTFNSGGIFMDISSRHAATLLESIPELSQLKDTTLAGTKILASLHPDLNLLVTTDEFRKLQAAFRQSHAPPSQKRLSSDRTIKDTGHPGGKKLT